MVLFPTFLRWILSGNQSGTTVTQITVHHTSLIENLTLENAARQFWDVESIGIQEKQGRTLTAKDIGIIQRFQ